MSDDPETLRQIEELAADDRPLLVLDVDDVLLEFIRPFPRFLEAQGYELSLSSFQLNGNIREVATGVPAEKERVGELIDAFFHAQADWQSVTEGAADAIASLDGRAEIVMLTHMPHRFRAARRAHLDGLGLHYPLLTTEMPKGPAIKRLRGDAGRPVAFVDDQPRNLLSARDSVPDVFLVHLMAEPKLRELMPPPPDGILVTDDWRDAAPKIASALGLAS